MTRYAALLVLSCRSDRKLLNTSESEVLTEGIKPDDASRVIYNPHDVEHVVCHRLIKYSINKVRVICLESEQSALNK
jgi:hypothetical protein